MFADMKSMVMKVWYEHYASLATNCMDLENAHAAIRVAKRNHAPVTPNLCQGHLARFSAPVTVAVVKTLVGSVSAPVALVLNHGKNPDCIRQTFRAGFSGLMIDASAFPLEEDVCQTRVVVKLATGTQLCVGGELGHLTGAPRYDQAANVNMMTQPTDVELSIAQTGIDLLAVSVGAVHGMYAPDVVSVIDFQHLMRIFHCSSMPLALHSGSGTSSDQLWLCTTLGVAKINVGAAIFKRGKSVLLHTLCHGISIRLVDVLKAMELVFEEAIIPCLQAGGSIGKA